MTESNVSKTINGLFTLFSVQLPLYIDKLMQSFIDFSVDVSTVTRHCTFVHAKLSKYMLSISSLFTLVIKGSDTLGIKRKPCIVRSSFEFS